MIIVLSNGENSPVLGIASDLAKILFGVVYHPLSERKVKEVDPAINLSYVGQYQLVNPGLEFEMHYHIALPDMVISISEEDGHLVVKAPEWSRTEVYPETETRYFAKSIDLQLSFRRRSDGEVTGISIRFGDNLPVLSAERIDD